MGNPTAQYRDAIAHHGAAIARLARAVERVPRRREELVQDIHLQLWRSFASFDGRCSLRTWVFRVAHNVAVAHVRKEARERTVPLADAEPSTADPVGVVERRDLLGRIHSVIRDLPAVDRQVALLYLEDLPAADIADVVGVSPNAVAIRIHRLKRTLAERLGGLHA